MRNLRLLLVAAALTSVAACAPREWARPLDLTTVSVDERAAASNVRVVESGVPHPAPVNVVGDVSATSCKHWVSDPPATRGNALQQLRVKALRMGANAVIDAVYDERGTDTYGTNCWETVTVTGIAANLPPQ